jgi:transcriptional regulator with PAS, ATPase and Fis domain
MDGDPGSPCIREAGSSRKILSAGAMRMLMGHARPGNVRKLKHCTERALNLAEEATLVLPERYLPSRLERLFRKIE